MRKKGRICDGDGLIGRNGMEEEGEKAEESDSIWTQPHPNSSGPLSRPSNAFRLEGRGRDQCLLFKPTSLIKNLIRPVEPSYEKSTNHLAKIKESLSAM